MGIYLNAFAVDVDSFNRLLDLPLWQAFLEVKRRKTSEDILFSVFFPEGKTRYAINSNRQVVRIVHTGARSSCIFEDDQLATVADLQQPLRAKLATESSYELAWLLRAEPTVDGAPCAREITSGYRPWWIASVLATARAAWGSGRLYTELAGYCARLLRGHRYYEPLELHADPPNPADFPIVPAEDVDYQMAVLNEFDCLHCIELLQKLMASEVPFALPRPDDSADAAQWDEWVRGMVNRFLAIPELGLTSVHLVSFIG